MSHRLTLKVEQNGGNFKRGVDKESFKQDVVIRHVRVSSYWTCKMVSRDGGQEFTATPVSCVVSDCGCAQILCSGL